MARALILLALASSACTAGVGDTTKTTAVADPTKPTAVGDPTKPTAVGDPTKPTAVGDPTKPTIGDPTKPTAVGDPTKTTVADPTKATVAVDPAKAGTTSCVTGKPFDEGELRSHLTELAAPELDGRKPGTPGDVAARKLIADRLACLGLAPQEQPFEAAGAKTANVLALVAGETDELVVVGAHHDHVGDKHLGANDNASGVVALLAIAQAVAQGAKPRRSILFATWGGEEIGLLGSTHFVAHPPRPLELARIVAYINLDMVGSYNSTKSVAAFGTFTTTAAGKLMGKLDDKYPSLRVGLGGHSVRGDQVPFCQARVPYVFFWTPDNRCYHETCDTIARIDFPHMSTITKLAHDLVRGLADDKADLLAARAKTGCGK